MKRHTVLPALLLAFTALGSGCASKLSLKNVQQLELGKTTAAELPDILGKPDATQRITDGGQNVFVLHEYNYLTSSETARVRVELLNERLNAFEYYRSSQAHPLPDGAAVADRIVERRSRKADVEALVGKASTRAKRTTRIKFLRDPMPAQADEVWGYYWIHRGLFSYKLQHLYVYFDAGGTVVSKIVSEATYP